MKNEPNNEHNDENAHKFEELNFTESTNDEASLMNLIDANESCVENARLVERLSMMFFRPTECYAKKGIVLLLSFWIVVALSYFSIV